MSSEQPVAPFAAAVYRPDGGDRMALARFVEDLQADGVRVGGLLQQAIYDNSGEIIGLDAVDVASGRRIALGRAQANATECGLDVAALAESSGIIRAAVEARAELVVVEKFGEQEQNGKGLIDEILLAISEGVPLLILVPAAALPLWQDRSGALGSVIDCNATAFAEWWRQVRQQ